MKSDRSFFVCILKSFLITVSVCAALLLLGAFFAYRTVDPERLIAPVAYAVLFFGAALCGFLAARFRGEKGLFSGAAAGALYACSVIVTGLILGGIRNMLLALLMCFGMVALAAVSGLLGLPRELSPEKIRRQTRKKYLSAGTPH